MQTTLLDSASGRRTFAVIFTTGEEVISGLQRLADEQRFSASHFTAIGAFSRLVVAFFDWDTKTYQRLPIDEQVEVLSLGGDIALRDGRPVLHAHVVVAKRDGTAHGGHLMEAHVRPTLEVVLTESPTHLYRELDQESGLALIRLPDSGAAHD
jgi:predicted DNA-binding protein with PD1-like motif